MPEAVVRVAGLAKTYPTAQGPLEVLRGIDLVIAAGEVVAISGASGSGKSTLLSLMAGLDRPTRGDVTLAGERLGALDEPALARIRRDKVGFVFQSYHLIPSLTVLENVALPLAFRNGRMAADLAQALLERVDLQERAAFFPEQLSGGEQQRAAVARALVNDPVVVFADEPTGNLDSANGRRVLDLLDAHTRGAGRTLVLVTHDADVAARADRRLILKDGVLA
jgi:putative ABC transport system ATP-binding protein